MSLYIVVLTRFTSTSSGMKRARAQGRVHTGTHARGNRRKQKKLKGHIELQHRLLKTKILEA